MRKFLRWLLGIDALIAESMEANIERVRRVSAAITGEEFVPKLIDCEARRPVHLWTKWEEAKGLGVQWTKPGSATSEKGIITKVRKVYRRECKACGRVETRRHDVSVLD